jgi:hypothetical protein
LALAAGVATLAVFWWSTGRSAGVQVAQSASLVPENAVFYLSADTDPTSPNWIALSRHARRLGLSEKFERWRDDRLAVESGLDWQKDIAPLLGGEASLFVLLPSGSEPSVGVLIRAQNRGAALDRLRQALDREASRHRRTVLTDSYDGVDIIYTRDASQEVNAVAVVGEYVVLADRRGVIYNIVDVQKGRRPALSARPHFRELQRRAGNDNLLFGYVDGANVWSALQSAPAGPGRDVSAVAQALGLKDGSELNQTAGAFLVRVEKASFRFEALAIPPPGSQPGATAPNYQVKLAQVAPADSFLFLSGYDLHAALSQPFSALASLATGAAGPASGPAGYASAMTNAQEQISQQLGIDVERDVLSLLTKEYALALPAPSVSRPDSVSVLVAAEVNNPAHMDVTLSKLSQAFEKQGMRVSRTPAGRAQAVSVEEPSSKQTIGYALRDDLLLVGYQANLVREALLRTGGGSLAEESDFIVTTSLLPNDRSGLLYVSLRRLITVLQDASRGDRTLTPDDWKNLGSLRGLAATTSVEDGIRRYTAVVTIDE